MKQELNLNEEICLEAIDIIEESGLSIDVAINIFLKKIVREGSIGFLFDKTEPQVEKSNRISQSCNYNFQPAFLEKKMTKSIAKRMFMDKGFRLHYDCFFASENSSNHVFWANIHNSVLNQNWSLILNDKTHSCLHLLSIPAGEFDADDLVMRADKPEIIDLQIAPNDPSFTDNRSGQSFSRFIVDTINY